MHVSVVSYILALVGMTACALPTDTVGDQPILGPDGGVDGFVVDDDPAQEEDRAIERVV